MRRLVLFAFGAIQLVLVARIAIDLGFLPAGGDLAGFIAPLSDTLAAPVRALGDAIGVDFTAAAGSVDPAIIGALVGLSAIEGIVLMIVARTQ
jgi:hypothetical protein